MNSARVCFATVALAAMTSLAPSATAQPFGAREVRGWIERNHPAVIAGDPRVNSVFIVLDTNGQYVASRADSLPIEVSAAIDSTFDSVGARNAVAEIARELVAGQLRVPGSEGQAVYIVDGVRVNRLDSLSADAIENIEFKKGADAVKYGAASNGGAIIVTTMRHEERAQVIASSNRRSLEALHLATDQVDLHDVQMMHVRGGVLGPNPLYVTIMHFKR